MQMDQVARALSDPIRLMILDLLAAGRTEACCSPNNPNEPISLCPCDMLSQLDNVAPSKLSYHIKELRVAGLIEETRAGKWNYYSLNKQTFNAFRDAIAGRYLLQQTATLSKTGFVFVDLESEQP